MLVDDGLVLSSQGLLAWTAHPLTAGASCCPALRAQSAGPGSRSPRSAGRRPCGIGTPSSRDPGRLPTPGKSPCGALREGVLPHCVRACFISIGPALIHLRGALPLY